MEKLANYFDHIQSWERTLIIASGLVLFWMLEGLIPLVRYRYHKVRHAGLNIFFTFTTIIVNLAFAALIVRASQYGSVHRMGLLYLFPMPLWLFTLIGLLLLDLIGAWFIHWLVHKVKWMWKFHLIHHSDVWVDTTTANRHHPGESVFRAVFTLLGVVVSRVFLTAVFCILFKTVSRCRALKA